MAEPYFSEDYVEDDYADEETLLSLLGFNVTAFQPDAFQWGFQIMDTIPTFVGFPIAQKFRRVFPGQNIVIPCEIADVYTSPRISLPFNPSSVPQIKIYNPDDTLKLDFTDMFFMNTGLYGYEHEVLTDDQKGDYHVQFTATNGEKESHTPKIYFFTVI